MTAEIFRLLNFPMRILIVYHKKGDLINTTKYYNIYGMEIENLKKILNSKTAAILYKNNSFETTREFCKLILNGYKIVKVRFFKFEPQSINTCWYKYDFYTFADNTFTPNPILSLNYLWQFIQKQLEDKRYE